MLFKNIHQFLPLVAAAVLVVEDLSGILVVLVVVAVLVIVGDYLKHLVVVAVVFLQQLGHGGVRGLLALANGSKVRYHSVGGRDLVLVQIGNIGQGPVDNGDHGEQDEHAQQHRQAAGHGVHAVLLVESHSLLVQLLLVLGIFLFKLIELGLEHRHTGRAFLLLDIQRQQYQPCDKRENKQRQRIIADQLVAQLHYPAERCSKHIEYKHFVSSFKSKRQKIFSLFFVLF